MPVSSGRSDPGAGPGRRPGSGSGSPRRAIRHGRSLRSPVTGPELPMIETRIDAFETIVGSTMEYLRSLWPNELSAVSLEVAGLPRMTGGDELPRWHALPSEGRIILYRVPIQRLAHLHVDDDYHRKAYVESCVVAAAAEYLGREPWDLAPRRFHPF